MLFAMSTETFQWITIVLLLVILACVIPVWRR